MWSKERNHLLVTVSGFTLLGVVNAVFDILDKEQPIPEVAVLPASGVLAGMFAVTMTKYQASRSQLLENKREGSCASVDNPLSAADLEYESNSDDDGSVTEFNLLSDTIERRVQWPDPSLTVGRCVVMQTSWVQSIP